MTFSLTWAQIGLSRRKTPCIGLLMLHRHFLPVSTSQSVSQPMGEAIKRKVNFEIKRAVIVKPCQNHWLWPLWQPVSQLLCLFQISQVNKSTRHADTGLIMNYRLILIYMSVCNRVNLQSFLWLLQITVNNKVKWMPNEFKRKGKKEFVTENFQL